MENGFELDFPGDDDNAELPVLFTPDAWDIGEPDAASIDDCGFGCMPMDHHDTVTTPVVRASVGGLYSLSFTTVTDDGSHTDTIRLTASELAQTAIVIEEYINGN